MWGIFFVKMFGYVNYYMYFCIVTLKANIMMATAFSPVPDNGFATRQEAIAVANAMKEWWGSNLRAWVEKRNGRYFPCYNLWN